jgi:hypothetical protein
MILAFNLVRGAYRADLDGSCRGLGIEGDKVHIKMKVWRWSCLTLFELSHHTSIAELDINALHMRAIPSSSAGWARGKRCTLPWPTA